MLFIDYSPSTVLQCCQFSPTWQPRFTAQVWVTHECIKVVSAFLAKLRSLFVWNIWVKTHNLRLNSSLKSKLFYFYEWNKSPKNNEKQKNFSAENVKLLKLLWCKLVFKIYENYIGAILECSSLVLFKVSFFSKY